MILGSVVSPSSFRTIQSEKFEYRLFGHTTARMANRSPLREAKAPRWKDFLCCVCCRDAEPEGPRLPTLLVQQSGPVAPLLTVPRQNAGIPQASSDPPKNPVPRHPDIAFFSNSHAPFLGERFGMFTFKDQPESADNSIDIIAIHGLGGHYEDIWTWYPAKRQSGTPCNWLNDLLPTRIPNARIISFGYNSAVALSKSIGDINTFGEQLLGRVLHERRSEQQKRRPIIFVCHSLGGIVAKKLNQFFFCFIIRLFKAVSIYSF